MRVSLVLWVCVCCGVMGVDVLRALVIPQHTCVGALVCADVQLQPYVCVCVRTCTCTRNTVGWRQLIACLYGCNRTEGSLRCRQLLTTHHLPPNPSKPRLFPFLQILPEKICFLAKGRDGEDEACARSLARSKDEDKDKGSDPIGGNWCACYSVASHKMVLSNPAGGPAGCEQNLMVAGGEK